MSQATSSLGPSLRSRPTQALILAGGRGTRLQPITLARPKPMVEFHGRPFLEYVIDLLREQGIERVLLLLGYLPEVIQDHFGDGSQFGVEIEYAVTEPDDLTGSRMARARDLVDDDGFLLLYCDNYLPLDMDMMWDEYRRIGAAGMVTVYRNRDGYTRDNMRIQGDLVAEYDPKREAPGLAGVEIGYAFLPKWTIDLLPAEDAAFEKAVYPQLVAAGELAAYPTDHRYYSVGSHERLGLTDSFLARRPAIILDRDGVLNRRPPRAQYVRRPEELVWLPDALAALRLLEEHGYRVIVVSNQAGVARGAMTMSDLQDVNARLTGDAREAGGHIDAVYCCPHGWDDGCECRKPRPGMLFSAQRDFDLDLSRTYFIGDDERDGEAAQAAGCPFILLEEEDSLVRAIENVLRTQQEDLA
jgi:histidinol-phosphate phosphatase family protein